MTITSTAPVLTTTGISAPSYADILDYLQVQYRSIFGADVYLGNDSQDGQLLAVFATAINDANNAAINVYNSFSPATAQGVALSSNVKLNGIARAVSTNSTANITIVGQAGTAITNGVVGDSANNKWNLPALVNIGGSGTVTATATCAVAGAVPALPGAINQILTPQLGWQSATNAAAAVPGAPVESDATLRGRQSSSVAQPSQTPLVGLAGSIAALTGVTRSQVYENPTNATDSNGLPPHSVSAVVEGGTLAAIASAISAHKTEGAFTYGSTSQTVNSPFNIAETINFFVLAEQRFVVAISLHPISGYTAAIGVEIQNAVAAYINGLAVGATSYLNRLYTPANLTGLPDGLTYEITFLGQAIYPATPAAADVAISFNQAAQCAPSDVVITLV